MAKRSRTAARTPPAPPERREPGRRAALTALIVFALVFSALAIGSYTQKSAVWDEPIHLADGYASLVQHDYRVDPEHPPFLRMWAALPLLALRVTPFDLSVIDRTAPDVWAQALFDECEKFLYVENDADRLLYAARFMDVALGITLGVLLFAWAREWLGFRAALVALACYTIEPNIAAHASLVTTDAGFACFMFGTIYLLWRTCRQPHRWNILGLTVFFALAVISKFTAAVLGPIVVVLLAIAVLRGSPLGWRKGALLLAGLAVAAWVAVWAIYGFRYAPSGTPTWLYQFQSMPVVQKEVPGLARIVTWIDQHHLVPNAFSQGFLLGQTKAQTRSAFLAGDISTRGWWYYFPLAWLIKTPVALLLLITGGLGVVVVRWRRLGSDTALFIVVPVVIYMSAAMAANLNIGLRHLLPLFPLALLLAAAAGRQLLAARSRAGAVVLGATLLGGAVEYGRNYPDHLAFFNAFVGGPDHGAEYLVDSNLDWGQDLKPLKRWMDAKGVSHINLSYFGTAYPPYYGINATLLPGSEYYKPGPMPQLPGFVALSETVLSGVYLSEAERAFYRSFRNRTPVATIGHSIVVYWVDEPWW